MALFLPLFKQNEGRELSSAGSEHLPYKQRVGGSNPSAPTRYESHIHRWATFFFSRHGGASGESREAAGYLGVNALSKALSRRACRRLCFS
jgi:hypothetical protein